jgi:hypothetical protein
LPSTKADLATVYTTQEEWDVYYDDAIRVALIGTASRYLIHQYKKLNDNRSDRIKVRVDLQSTIAPVDSNTYLQIWNGQTNTWETLDSISGSADDYPASTDFSLYGDVTDTSYFDFNNEVAVRVYQLNNTGFNQTLSVDLVQFSFKSVFTSKYISRPIAYVAKYFHKSPQDDN